MTPTETKIMYVSGWRVVWLLLWVIVLWTIFTTSQHPWLAFLGFVIGIALSVIAVTGKPYSIRWLGRLGPLSVVPAYRRRQHKTHLRWIAGLFGIPVPEKRFKAPKAVQAEGNDEWIRWNLDLSQASGITVEDVETIAANEMLALGMIDHRVTIQGTRAVIEYTAVGFPDPLEGVRHADLAQVSLSAKAGRLMDGTDAYVDLRDASHVAIQGMTRSGKSALCYTLLGQWAQVPRDQLELVMVDPNRVLGAPLQGRARTLLGTDAQEVLDLITDLVAEMDRRLRQLVDLGIEAFTNEHFDSGQASVLAVVLEEWPALRQAIADGDKPKKPAERLWPRIEIGVGRLLREGAKVGFRLVLIAQRMDTNIIDGSLRGQFGTRITMAVDNSEAVRMLHPMTPPETVAQVIEFPPGRCLWWQHRKEQVMQADLTEYQSYRAATNGTQAV